jgi:hypothetical protein
VSVALPVVGSLLILLTLREVFHMLFHPSGQGGLTMLVFRGVWALTGKLGERARSVAGPLSVVLVIAFWIGGLIVGFSLIYWPSLPEGFIYASGLEPEAEDDYLDALYYSWVTQSTLGYGDIAPEQGAFRILGPVQATLGFALFTLFVTWVLSVYPALHRQRAAASSIHAMRIAHGRGVPVKEMHPAALARQMDQLSEAISDVRVDLVQYPSTFYFAAPASTMGLAHGLPFLAAVASTDGLADEARPAAARLAASFELLAAVLAEQHLDIAGAETDDVLRAYRRHHGLDPEEERA